MISIKEVRVFSALFVTGAFLIQNSAFVFSARPQKIPVTSTPVGAEVTVDKERVGFAPLNLSLTRDRDHTVRIEKPGYVPVEIRVERESTGVGRGSSFTVALISAPPGCGGRGFAGWNARAGR